MDFPAALAARRPRFSAAWHRLLPDSAAAPELNAKHYHGSIGTRCATTAAPACPAAELTEVRQAKQYERKDYE